MKTPRSTLDALSADIGHPVDSDEFARHLDKNDPLSEFREKFQYPKKKELPIDGPWCSQPKAAEGDEECVYMCGNSLGLKPKKADDYMRQQLEKWQKMGVMMHFEDPLPAAGCDLPGKKYAAELVGAKHEHEVAWLNSLTVNLNMLMMAFYRPDKRRFKIVIEAKAFPSDRYAMVSLLNWHGLQVENALIQLSPRPGEHTLRTQDILEAIDKEKDSIAVVILAGLQYYTGQLFDMKSITEFGRARGVIVGWDLAHAVGNVSLKLHEWGVDFACWCSYKYLNSGAGGIGGIFLHDRHCREPPTHLCGWWSNKEETRFRMSEKVDMAVGADAFRMSNPPPWLMCLAMASLEIFHEAGMDRIVEKQFLLTGYLEYLIREKFSPGSDSSRVTAEIITPSDPAQRGSQLSLVFSADVGQVHKKLEQRGVVCDVRRPNVIRLAPAPLYNSFDDVRKFVKILYQGHND